MITKPPKVFGPPSATAFPAARTGISEGDSGGAEESGPRKAEDW